MPATLWMRATLGIGAFALACLAPLAMANDDMGEDDGDATEIQGVVQSMPASGFVGDWMIGGKSVTTTAATKIDQEHGALVVGAVVEVDGTASMMGGPLLATKIEVKSSPSTTPPTPGPGGDDGDDDGDMEDGDFTGPIQALPDGTLIGTWTVGGKKVIVLTTTRLEQENGGFVVGAIVEVEGTPGADGIVASEIKVKSSMSTGPEPEDDGLEIQGLIEALPAGGLVGTWKVAGRDVVVTDQTKLEADHGPFVVGAPVDIEGFPLPGGGVQATKIETEKGNGADVPALEFFGAIEQLPPSGLVGVWKVSGKLVTVTTATELDTGDGPFVVGATVKVEGWAQSDGAIEAHEIETTSEMGVDPETSKVAVEFFNAGLGHFFVTAAKGEIAALDAGAFGGAWTRTGQTMKVGGDVGVCRFFGMPPKGPPSHFFTVDPAECQFVMSNYPTWTFEGHAFGMTAPVNGACAAGLVPVHRLFNNPASAMGMNHRYTTDPAVVAQMVGLGWIDEGVVMCAQP